MKALPTEIDGVLLFEPAVFEDGRGHFSVTFNRTAFEQAMGHAVQFEQDNESLSRRCVLRGLHCQLPPHAQGKLIRVCQGRVLDVAVDLRPHSTTLGRWFATELSGENRRQLWIPPNFAHGFQVLSEIALVQYKLTGTYMPAAERSIRWDDPALDIAWADLDEPPQVSDKDQAGLPAATVIAEIRAAMAAEQH